MINQFQNIQICTMIDFHRAITNLINDRTARSNLSQLATLLYFPLSSIQNEQATTSFELSFSNFQRDTNMRRRVKRTESRLERLGTTAFSRRRENRDDRTPL